MATRKTKATAVPPTENADTPASRAKAGREALPEVYRQFVTLCREEGMLVEHVMEACYRDFLADETGFVAIDCGAHAGFHTRRLADIAGCELVHAVEAAPIMIARMEKLAASSEGRIAVVGAAVQDDPDATTLTFKVSSTHPGRSGIQPIWDYTPEVEYSSCTVSATTIDRIASDGAQPVRFIKLDLEGGEFAAMRGGQHTLEKQRPILATENSIHAARVGGFARADVYDFLKARDYVPMTFWGDVMNPENEFAFWYAWMVPAEKADMLSETAARHVRAAVAAKVPSLA